MFAETDDGQEFFMVNMIETRTESGLNPSGETMDPRERTQMTVRGVTRLSYAISSQFGHTSCESAEWQ